MSDETDAWARVIARKLARMQRELGENAALEALVGQIVDNAQALARDVPLVLPPVPALQQWLAEHMNAAIRDLLSADPPEVVVFLATATAHAKRKRKRHRRGQNLLRRKFVLGMYIVSLCPLGLVMLD